jgi:hypothetical protein
MASPTMDPAPTTDAAAAPSMASAPKDTEPLSVAEIHERFILLSLLRENFPELKFPEPASAFMVHPAFRYINASTDEQKGEEKPDTDEMIRRYRTMEAAANRLQKESKGYLDSLRGTCE